MKVKTENKTTKSSKRKSVTKTDKKQAPPPTVLPGGITIGQPQQAPQPLTLPGGVTIGEPTVKTENKTTKSTTRS